MTVFEDLTSWLLRKSHQLFGISILRADAIRFHFGKLWFYPVHKSYSMINAALKVPSESRTREMFQRIRSLEVLKTAAV